MAVAEELYKIDLTYQLQCIICCMCQKVCTTFYLKGFGQYVGMYWCIWHMSWQVSVCTKKWSLSFGENPGSVGVEYSSLAFHFCRHSLYLQIELLAVYVQNLQAKCKVVFPQKPSKPWPPSLGNNSWAAQRNLHWPPMTLYVAASGVNGRRKYQICRPLPQLRAEMIFSASGHPRSPQVAGGRRQLDPWSICDQCNLATIKPQLSSRWPQVTADHTLSDLQWPATQYFSVLNLVLILRSPQVAEGCRRSPAIHLRSHPRFVISNACCYALLCIDARLSFDLAKKWGRLLILDGRGLWKHSIKSALDIQNKWMQQTCNYWYKKLSWK